MIEYYQQGIEAGQEAQNHHLLQIIIDGAKEDGLRLLPRELPSSFPDKQFLEGYMAGLGTFFSIRNIKIPTGTYLTISTLPTLEGYVMGLERKEPEETKTATTTRAADWSAAEQFIAHHLWTEGYFIGFWASIIRDFDLPISHHEIPTGSVDYKLFIAGSRGAEIGVVPMTSYLRQKWATEFDREAAQWYPRMKYTGGLRVWLQQQGLDTELADQLTHPESLRAFKKTLQGQIIDEANLEPEALIGHQLGKTARSGYP